MQLLRPSLRLRRAIPIEEASAGLGGARRSKTAVEVLGPGAVTCEEEHLYAVTSVRAEGSTRIAEVERARPLRSHRCDRAIDVARGDLALDHNEHVVNVRRGWGC